MKGSWNNSSKQPLSENDRIKQLLVRVGDDGPNFYKRDIKKLSSNIETFYQKADFEAKEFLLNTLVECIGALTLKASVYATTVSLVSVQHPAFPELVIDKLVEKLRVSLDKGDIHVPRSTLIFLGELMNMGLFNAFLYINILLDLFNEAETSLETSADYYLYVGIPVLPYVVMSLREKNRIELNGLVQTIEKIMNRRDKNYLKGIRVSKDQQSVDSRLDVMWNEIKNYMESGTKTELTVLIKPYDEFKDELAQIKEIKKNIKLSFNSKNTSNCVYQSPPFFSFFGNDILRKETQSNLDLIILQEKIVDILMTFYKSRKYAAQFLLKLSENQKCPYLIVEGVFDEMFNLPQSHSKLVFYTGVLISLINETPQNNRESVSKIVHEAINTIFKNSDKYDVEILERFSDFFAHFLSNFNFEWDWSQWKYAADLDHTSSELILLKQIFVKMVRLSFRDRIVEILPEELKPLLPPAEPTNFEYDGNKDAETIKDKFNAKPTIEEMNEWIGSGDNNIESSNEKILDIFVQCLLNRASKTLTHLNAHFDKYNSTIALLVKEESYQTALLDTVAKFWKNSTFHAMLTVRILEKFKLVDSKNIVSWAFKAFEKEEDLHDNFSIHWEIFFSLLARISSDTDLYNQEILRAEANKEESHDFKQKLEATQEEQQTILTLVFEKFNHLLAEVFANGSTHQPIIISRLLQVIRRYRREIDGIYAKIEEDLAPLENESLQETLSQIKELKFASLA